MMKDNQRRERERLKEIKKIIKKGEKVIVEL